MTGVSLAEAAASYARRGWRVLPCAPREKYPVCTHGLHDASCDDDLVRWWWRRWPEANIGIRTGDPIDVIDVDSPEGMSALTDAASVHRLGWGPVSSTGRGWHYWIAGEDRRSRIGFLPGVDLKATGGYVIAPPSIHPTGRQYRWLPRHGPDDVVPETAPDWLGELLDPAPKSYGPRTTSPLPWSDHAQPTARVLRYARAALQAEAEMVAGAVKGTRNDSLNKAAYRMRRFLEAGHLAESDVVAGLVEAAIFAGLPEIEARRTIASGLGIGQ
jgi:hypothetical protein